jgi:hypothetical protein
MEKIAIRGQKTGVQNRADLLPRTLLRLRSEIKINVTIIDIFCEPKTARIVMS